jgi:spermidine synthase
VIRLAREDLFDLNRGSLFDDRVQVHVMDAFDFASHEKTDGGKFDLIICDLTLPRTTDGAALLSTDWFELLASILNEHGIVALNGLSPCKHSDPYWSIYNSLRAANLSVKPFRIPLPSFREAGFGPDWGFFLASRTAFDQDELFGPLEFATPATQLKTGEQWRKLFLFPAALAGRRAFSRPAARGSDLFITYLSNPNDEGCLLGGGTLSATDRDFDFLSMVVDDEKIPPVDRGETILPTRMAAHLGAAFCATEIDAEKHLEEIICGMAEFMPALDPGHNRSMVEQFLDDPVRFIRGIDLPELVNRLLERAAELPRRFVEELRLLKQKLTDFVLDRDAVLALGSKALAVIALVVILGNLVFTDNAYGKGGHASTGHVSDSPGSLSRPSHSAFDGGFAPAEYASGPGFRPGIYGSRTSVDETGFVYPARRYRYYGSYSSHSYYSQNQAQGQPLKEIYASYRLTPEADVLPDGTVVISLTDQSYLRLGAACNTLVDAWTGVPICDLARDPAQTYRVCREVDRQIAGLRQSIEGKKSWNSWVCFLDFVPWYHDDMQELSNLKEMEQRLETARRSLGGAPPMVPPLRDPPEKLAIEVFASVWLRHDGLSLIIERPEGLAYYNESGWYSDAAFSQAIKDYPRDLGRVVLTFYQKVLNEQDETSRRLLKEKADATADYYGFIRDLGEYKECYGDTAGYELVDYGSSKIRLDDAYARTVNDVNLSQQRIEQITAQLDGLPNESALALVFVKKYAAIYDKKEKEGKN